METVKNWVTGIKNAVESNNPDKIEELFTELNEKPLITQYYVIKGLKEANYRLFYNMYNSARRNIHNYKDTNTYLVTDNIITNVYNPKDDVNGSKKVYSLEELNRYIEVIETTLDI